MTSPLLQRNASVPRPTATSTVAPPPPPLVLYPPSPAPAPTPAPAPAPGPPITIQTSISECEIMYGRFVASQPVGPSQIAMLTTFKTMHPECTAWVNGRLDVLSIVGAPAHQAKPSLLPLLGIALGIGALIYFTK